MNIGIDAMWLGKQKTGIGTYVEKILEELNKKDAKNKYYLYSNDEIILDFKPNANFIIKDKIEGKRVKWVNYVLPKILKEDKIDIFWGPQYMLPKRNKYTKNMKFYITIYDLAMNKFKNIGAFRNILTIKLFLRRNMKSADKIIAISNSTKKDIMEMYKVPEEKIIVTYLGVEFPKKTEEKLDINEKEIRGKFGIENSTPYLFFLSTIEPRKNIETLIKAFEFIKEKEKTNLKLILAGGLGWNYENILKLYETSKFKKDIVMPGYISKEEKKFLYENACMFIYPSLYEGFGLPVLEAMVNKSIVVTTNNSSLPEVGGNAAFYYENTLDYKELGNRILEVMNLSIEEREEKIQEGIDQAKKFTWEKCTKETADILLS